MNRILTMSKPPFQNILQHPLASLLYNRENKRNFILIFIAATLLQAVNSTSLLPKYCGAAPIQWAIAHGLEDTGVSIMEAECQNLIHPMYSASLSIVLLVRSSRHLDLTTARARAPLVRVQQRSDLPLRVCFHLVEHCSLSAALFPS